MTSLENELDVLANRFNYEPAVMLGASQQEILKGVFIIIIPVCLIVGFLLLPVLHNFLFGLSAGIFIGITLFLIAFKWLQQFRKGQQVGYLTQQIQRKLSRKGIAYHDVIHRTGTWIMGRKL